ncbi:carbohydrate ABC transporter permease [Paenibacillus roseipurpureus]|uniref:Carbohydrate ABC transporter permease n=1 Tax=Paenibacillus roseopurpureus TaxID=2918901 RepID=A0AA96LNI2_9BACL|nr:carbohydrate ABC transporter permease [Paenibacillus sp. MBLB1832]WNR42973.1 carbohydrate ABC transporter permease [Paenibacillus sp. MBLB1832]
MKPTKGENIFHFLVVIFFIIASFCTLYPFWHVLMYAISDPKASMGGGLFFLPRGFSLYSFELMLQTKGIFQSYVNSLFRLIVGTFIALLFTAMLAYPLSVRRFAGRNTITMLIFFTMLFNGGLIPNYLLIKQLGMLNTLWALIIPGAISAWNLFIMKNFFQSIPPELEESANIDGASPARTLFSIILPISMPVMAAVALFYGVAHWNSYFDAIVYISDPKKQVLQVFLRGMMNVGSLSEVKDVDSMAASSGTVTEESIKMATIVMSVLPMLIVYPFLQKYYVKGVLVGSVKG